jgi:hypothetical protein
MSNEISLFSDSIFCSMRSQWYSEPLEWMTPMTLRSVSQLRKLVSSAKERCRSR